MKKLKINLLAIIGTVVAVTTLAFTAPKENLTAEMWYEVNPNDGSITQSPDESLPLLCPQTNDTEYCAIKLDASTPVPSNIKDTDLEGGSVQTLEHRFRTEE